ncbi:glutamine amidotransferase [Pseudomonas oryzihabitans]|uniref:glutamine amidotransferase n=1 Tax=Pseudomonas oryzihabitans TaxID=47885 RepID=UPI00285A0B05|nr:glutamine amidotransferase [Pseudomonas psychrotolerans]MDR6678418.1 GMP synthase (glutamine-hydrolyzing) [Pseudomonas psychrotolerans]
MPPKPLAIFQMGKPPADIRQVHQEQSDWILAALGELQRPVAVYNVEEQPPPSPSAIAAAVITGSWSMVTEREPWSERIGAWIRLAMALELPLLGICYGHQLMADALGGVVDYHPDGREIGQRLVCLNADAAEDPLLARAAPRFPAYLTHEQSVLLPPAGATVLGGTDHDPHQIIRYSPTALSVQFHPEFTPALMKACLLRRRTLFVEEGFDLDRLCLELGPTPEATGILRRFVEQIGE